MIRKFLSYVEIMTKITSTFAFLLTIAFLFYQKISINWYPTLVFFSSMFLFDLTTTAINNYIDSKTNGQMLPFSRKTAKGIIYLLLCMSILLGLYLVVLTDIIVFIVGVLCFLCGIIYTFGPLPISRQPWGEVFSGLFYGFLIPFLLFYINLPSNSLVELNLSYDTITVKFHCFPLFTLFLLSMIPMCTTANIMLANNICDLEKDIKVKRYTLPYYIGKNALYLYAVLYYISFGALVFMILLKILSPLCFIVLITLIPVKRNMRAFFHEQKKETTFFLSIKNYMAIMGSTTLMIFVSGLLT